MKDQLNNSIIYKLKISASSICGVLKVNRKSETVYIFRYIPENSND
jgi:hypothetical protein